MTLVGTLCAKCQQLAYSSFYKHLTCLKLKPMFEIEAQGIQTLTRTKKSKTSPKIQPVHQLHVSCAILMIALYLCN